MSLTLTIRNVAQLENGAPSEFVLHRRGALIGRSPTCDWSLPDPAHHISSRHCEIRYEGGFYTLTDTSTNGTHLNQSPERMAEPRRIADGDLFTVGTYEVVARLSGEALAQQSRERDQAASAAEDASWKGWQSAAPPPAPPPPDPNGWAPAPAAAPASDWGAPAAPAQDASWGAPAPAPSGGGGDWGAAPQGTGSGGGGWKPQLGPSLARPDAHRAAAAGMAPASAPAAPMGGGWAPSARAPDLPVASTWEPHVAKPDPASAWSSAAPDRPRAASPDDIWGKIADGNVVDWARGGFGQPVVENADPLGLNKAKAQESLPAATPRMVQFGRNDAWGDGDQPQPPAAAPAAPANAGWDERTPTAPPQPRAPAPAPTPPAAPAPGGNDAALAAALVAAFAAGAGITPDRLKDRSPAAIDRAGQLFRKLVAGLVVMVEARARAKSQMGAESTSFEFDGNNPIKFARTPDEAIAQLLNPPERGFMESGRAIEDAFFDLQSHQMATLKAMQGALRATLDRFSPTAIRKRADTGGLMAKISPAHRDAALWQAYEREFGGVAQGSDEAFMDVFAKEFRKAYDEQSAKRPRGKS